MIFSVIPNFIRKTKVGSSVSTYSDSAESRKRSGSLQENAGRQAAIFPPNETKTCLILKKSLFSRTGDTYPIETKDAKLYHNLQVREKYCREGEMIVEDAISGAPKIVIVRYVATTGYRFHIYVTQPIYEEQEPINRMIVKRQEWLYPFGRVERSGSTLQVFVADCASSSTPTYTIQRARTVSHSTTYAIRYQGKAVASTSMYGKNLLLLNVCAGSDASFMFCLVVIADELSKQESSETQRFLDYPF